jgi:hypothetical protein
MGLLVSYCDGIGQVSLLIEQFEKTNSSINLNLKVTNESEDYILLKRVKKKYDVIDYFTPAASDSINYEGVSFLLFKDRDILKVDWFPINLRHRSKLVNWLDLFWLKIKNAFTNSNLELEGNTSINKKVIVNLDGFGLKESGVYTLQIVYHLPNTKMLITSNEINF